MMRALRQHIGWWFFLLVVVPFMGWMVFDVGMGVTGQSAPSSNPTVLEIDGTDIRFQEWDVARRQAYEQARQQQGISPTTREEQEELEDRLVDQLVQQILLQHEYRRLGIGVTDEEIVQAARLAPPPEVMSAPDFQTNGQFDQSKWERFLASGAARELLLALEARYRQQIPESKLVQRIVADVYVSDAKLWRMYRDTHDSVSVRLLRVTSEHIAPDAVTVAESDLRAYYDSHQDDFKRPAAAVVSFVAVDRRPNAADSAEALATARRIRDEVSRPGGGAGSRVERFAEVARRESRDTASGREGGDLGWVKRGLMVAPFEAALFRLAAGQISQPVATQFGYHIILAERVARDSIKARHILVPVELAGQHLDQVDARVDSLDRYLADQPGGGSQLDTVAGRMGLPVAHAELREDQPLLLGRYRVPDVHLWAFEATPGSTSLVIEGQVAFYVFRLDSVQPAGVAPLDEVRALVTEAVRREKQMAEARKVAEQLGAAVARTRSLVQAAQTVGRPIETLPPFTRTRPPPAISGEVVLLGTAFGLKAGEVSGLIAGDQGFYFLESVARRGADSTAWRAQLATQREQVLADARQARVQMYVGALREQANVEDRRNEVYKPQPEIPNSP